MPITPEFIPTPNEEAVRLPNIEPGKCLMLPHCPNGHNEVLTIRCLANDFGGEVFATNTSECTDGVIEPFDPRNKKYDIPANGQFEQELAIGLGETALVIFKHRVSPIIGTPN